MYQNKYIVAQILDSALLKRSCNHVTIKMKLLWQTLKDIRSFLEFFIGYC